MKLRPSALSVATLLAVSAGPPAAAKVDFSRDIRPILSDKCFACHGPDAKHVKGDLRLDLPASATRVQKNGRAAIVPGNAERSLVMERILTTDQDDVMPPPETHKKLSPKEVATLRQWIQEGAVYQEHWAYRKLVRPAVPAARDAVDHFVRARLAEEGVKPAPAADAVTLIRRLSFDLTGLPPTPGEVADFVRASAAEANRGKAVAELVDRLLTSPHYGERMAMYWLDLVRYADTRGYHGDQHQDITPYRDYVIKSFNENRPFDQFTAEQLAGDLLPEAGQEAKIASGYNRLLMTTEEGGAQPKEYTAKYVADRVRNASSVWLGSTLGCAECHDHKYDPFTQKDFYSFGAFFADVKETAVGKLQTVPLPTEEQKQRQAELGKSIAALEKQVREELARIKYAEPVPEKTAGTKPAAKPAGATPSELVLMDDDLPACRVVRTNPGNPPFEWTTEQVFSGKRAWKRSDQGLAQDVFDELKQPYVVGSGDRVFVHVHLDPKNPPRAVMLQYHSGDWRHRAVWGDPDAISYGTKGTAAKHVAGPLPEAGKWVRLEVEAAKLGMTAGTVIDHFALTQFGGTVYWDKVGALTTADQDTPPAAVAGKGSADDSAAQTSFAAWEKLIAKKNFAGLDANLKKVLQKPAAKRSKAEAAQALNHYLEHVYAPAREVFAAIHSKLNPLKQERDAIDKAIVRTMVSEPVEPRMVRVLPRGNWLDDSGPAVTPAVPAFLGKLATADRRATRLDLARWLTSRDNPLVARVFVNRVWKIMFGRGLATSLEDFGMQGTHPSHPELLDWLAVEFIESGWDVKRLFRLLALSETYRQSSLADAALRAHDPYNDLFARQGRFRLDAEMVRDNALQVSGLLVDQIGGQSVRPYQPAGYWVHLNFPKREWQNSTGEDLHRRGLYTYWCRTFLHPSLAAFDASTREECVVERVRSNTPQQALVLLNDPTYVEAARRFAGRILKEGGKDSAERIKFAYREALSRAPRPDETQLLAGVFAKHLADYRADAKAAEELLKTGASGTDKSLDAAELAAWTSVARVLFNLHEFITRS